MKGNMVEIFKNIIIKSGIASNDEIDYAMSVNGVSLKTLDDIVYVKTGEKSAVEFCKQMSTITY